MQTDPLLIFFAVSSYYKIRPVVNRGSSLAQYFKLLEY